ncbi:MAG: aminoacyltransferase [Rothia sp. (in: high G+C Gram-positive bacteria)]|uniref:aminoacyltransferase n=1 Tax=Rothia sp. (in: high G+C Gram-positive bacteria) TaxID=1885016 RepID=UPI0026DF20D5|nr:aminoacyltransferase [Rothia sp. (in: high G+C Gram-positive bacteria)]MDO5750150.1 aminoacyltransferase [Rothia sp. (in: high G+C Gram-positive bacteria)]
MSIRILDAAQFADLTARVSSGSYSQSEQMVSLLLSRGYTVYRAGYEADGAVQVGAVVYTLPMFGGERWEVHTGPLYTDERYLDGFYRALAAFATSKGALELVVRPNTSYRLYDSNGEPTSEPRQDIIDRLVAAGYVHGGLSTGYTNGYGDWRYVKDLSGIETRAQLLKSFSKRGKPLVKKANTFGIKLRALGRDELHIFKQITEATSDRREYEDKTLEYYQKFYDAFGEAAEFMVTSLNFHEYAQNLKESQAKLAEKIAKLEERAAKGKKSGELNELRDQYKTFDVRLEEAQEFISRYGDQDVILSGSLFVYAPHETVYLFSGSYPEFNRFYAPALLQEHVMMKSIERGVPFYNFLGITGQFDGSDGVLRFKQNFDGYVIQLPGAFTYYPSPLKYRVISLVKKVLGRS